MSYALLKALHLISVVVWFAGLFYIFRLFVYHVENRDKPETVALFETMERRLYHAICWPGMILTTSFGLAMLAYNPGLLRLPWFHIKLTGLVFLFAYHFYSGKVRKDFLRKQYKLSSKQCRIINEVPSVILIVVILAVILKPSFAG